MSDLEVGDAPLEVFMFFADGIVHEVNPSSLAPYVAPDFPSERLDSFLSQQRRPSDIPGFSDQIRATVNRTNTESIKNFNRVFAVLDSRILAPLLTNTLQLARDMTPTERENLLKSLRDSPIPAKRKLWRSIHSLSMSTFAKLAGDDLHKAMGYSGETRTAAYEGNTVDTFRYTFMEKPHASGHKLYIPGLDAIIIGSGSGAGVVAKTLSENGYKSLVIEKGKYFHPSEFPKTEADATKDLYESGGSVASESQHIYVTAGSCFGGGSTVNWSASLKTPFKVRKEWYDEFGLDWAAQDTFDECLSYVCEQMGVTTEGIDHSFANQVILNASKRLDYKCKAVPQNNGGHPSHNCGNCHMGCSFGIKAGSAQVWFREPAEKGTKFMVETVVERILHERGKATGVVCRDLVTGTEFTITGPRHIVVAGGTLNTPVVLQKSGFTNGNIGANLKLHPATTVWGDFGPDNRTKPFEKPILTTVCSEVDDLDGKAHGAKIETILHTPFTQVATLPWKSAEQARINMLRYPQLAGMVLIDRDTSSGKITYDKQKPSALVINYDVNKYDRKALLEAVLIASDLLYIEGAIEIIPPQVDFPMFRSSKHKEERTIHDKEYLDWRADIAKRQIKPYSTPFLSAHQMSSCRMGSSPRLGAADPKGRLWECRNVWVCDASALPTASGVNPMVSTMAVARHNALELVKELAPQVRL
ncbi:hypothetical protein DIURU_002004 [Diutina rugosa]|uniref:Long-chain-alcohol oxidase n=1 Tax=Diutina rugosa TaxID=5481 RepID=A0A642URQ8_DIURU|nr:uncharacterized protein DIURU_002004 [Diutina rugosa]KAA8904052.1 hypothetical protein DIURU_002004 [Diutina rugosa]